MSKGKLYGVGVGPGDKELITVKALKVLNKVEVIAVPIMKSGIRTAFNIIEDYVNNKKIINCMTPMSKDFDKLHKNYEKISDMIEVELKNENNVAFITIGDPTVYSTYIQINSIISERGYETEIIPGITSFCGAAAKLNIPLCDRNESLVILPASYSEFKDSLDIKGTKVLMKANKDILKVREILREKGLINKSYMVECCGMENERIYRNLDEIDEKTSYFSIIIVK